MAQVFFYECKGEVEQAVRLARAAFDEAVARMEELSGDQYKDAALLLQLLRDNMLKWGTDVLEVEAHAVGDAHANDIAS